MSTQRALRYLAPNLVTSISLLFGLLSVAATVRGDFASAGWWIVYATLTDRLDGLVARLVRGTSALGVQLDSFADFLNFGLAPAFLIYVSLGQSPLLPFRDGPGRWLLVLSCVAWILAATFRLARFNIADDPPPGDSASPGIKIYFGVPTTLAGGILVLWYLALYKYGAPGEVFPGLPGSFGSARLIDWITADFVTPVAVWRYMPVAMLVFAYLMVSSLPVPQFGRPRSAVALVIFCVLVASGIIGGFGRIFPEYLAWPPTIWIVVYLVWGQISPVARRAAPPPVFPRDGA